jgi:transcriptional regulator with XRE-family HTH domain
MDIHFHSNIKKLRKGMGISQSELARAMDVQMTTVTHWESGRSTPQFAVLVKLRHFFGVNLEELVFYDLSKKYHPPDQPVDEMNSADVKRIEDALEALDRKVDKVAELEEDIRKLQQQVAALQDRRVRKGNSLQNKIDEAIEGDIG